MLRTRKDRKYNKNQVCIQGKNRQNKDKILVKSWDIQNKV